MKRHAVALLVSMISAAGIVTVPAVKAQSCAMPEMPITGAPKDRLNLAEKDLKDGRYSQAYRIARSLFELSEATAAQKAEGHAIAGWVLMHNGATDEARRELQTAKNLDAAAVGTVLAAAKDDKVNAAVKKAIEA